MTSSHRLTQAIVLFVFILTSACSIVALAQRKKLPIPSPPPPMVEAPYPGSEGEEFQNSERVAGEIDLDQESLDSDESQEPVADANSVEDDDEINPSPSDDEADDENGDTPVASWDSLDSEDDQRESTQGEIGRRQEERGQPKRPPKFGYRPLKNPPLAQPDAPQTKNIRPYQITKKGEYVYSVSKSPQTHAFTLKVGSFFVPDLRNPETGITFNDIYSNASTIMVSFDYEWQLLKNIGVLGLKLGSGIFNANGGGRFRKARAAGSDTPEERYNFFLFPNNLGAIYHFQYWDKQILIPYVEGGADYFTIFEMRDDGAPLKYAGAAALHASAGLQIQLDWIDPNAIHGLDTDYGINHMYLTGEYRRILGLDPRYDFTDDVFSGGLMVEF